MTVEERHIKELVRRYMLQQNLGYMHINASIGFTKEIKISIVEEIDESNNPYNYN